MLDKTPSIYIILLNYNGHHDTIACLESINKLSFKNFRVILIDNHSLPESYTKIKEWGAQMSFIKEENILSFSKEKQLIGNTRNEDKYVLISSFENLGFANGNNIGIEYAKQNNADYVYLLNNDTEVEPDSLTKLVDFIEQNEYVAVTPQIRFYEPSDKIWNCGGSYSWPGSISYNYGNKNINEVPQTGHENISFITGCALLYDYKKIGPLSHKFFFGEEDNELSFRIRKMDLKMACVFDAVIYHKVSQSIKKTANATANRAQILYLNRFINFKDQYSFLNYWACILINTAYGIPMLMIRHKIGFIKSVKIFYTCIKDALSLDMVSKEKFETILSQK